jgi:peptidoglycan/LPS O-acetylase OafA/YrhL
MDLALTACSPGAAQDPQRLPWINGLRGLAVLGVMWHHAFFAYFRYGHGSADVPLWLNAIASSGWLGVNLFFFLSGFVLYLPYAQGRRTFDDPGERRAFFARRLARLYPLYTLFWLVVVLACLPKALPTPGLLGLTVVYGLVVYPATPMTFMPPGCPQLWSIGIEFWFSGTFPLVAAGRIHWSVLLPIVLVTAFVCRALGHSSDTGQALLDLLNPLSDSLFGRLDDFALGMFASHLFARGSFVAGRPWWLALAAILWAGVIALWWARSNGLVHPAAVAPANLMLTTGLLLALPTIIAGRSLVSHALLNSGLQLLGMMSYSLYLWHSLVFDLCEARDGLTPLAFLCALLPVLILSWITYRYVECRGVASWRQIVPPGLPRAWERLQSSTARGVQHSARRLQAVAQRIAGAKTSRRVR